MDRPTTSTPRLTTLARLLVEAGGRRDLTAAPTDGGQRWSASPGVDRGRQPRGSIDPAA